MLAGRTCRQFCSTPKTRYTAVNRWTIYRPDVKENTFALPLCHSRTKAGECGMLENCIHRTYITTPIRTGHRASALRIPFVSVSSFFKKISLFLSSSICILFVFWFSLCRAFSPTIFVPMCNLSPVTESAGLWKFSRVSKRGIVLEASGGGGVGEAKEEK